ncbi:MAG: hypothetical protein ACK4F8_14060 [Aquabacterium sp.]
MSEIIQSVLVSLQPDNELSVWPLLMAGILATSMILRRRKQL